MQKYFPIAVDTLRQEGFAAELSSLIQKWRKELKVDLTDRIWLKFLFNKNEDELKCALHVSKADEPDFIGVDSEVYLWSKLYEIVPKPDQKLWWMLNTAYYLTGKSNIYSVEVFQTSSVEDESGFQGFEVTKGDKRR